MRARALALGCLFVCSFVCLFANLFVCVCVSVFVHMGLGVSVCVSVRASVPRRLRAKETTARCQRAPRRDNLFSNCARVFGIKSRPQKRGRNTAPKGGPLCVSCELLNRKGAIFRRQKMHHFLYFFRSRFERGPHQCNTTTHGTGS